MDRGAWQATGLGGAVSHHLAPEYHHKNNTLAFNLRDTFSFVANLRQ